MYTIFYSWQSDLPNRTNRGYIEECIKKGIGNLSKSDEYRLELNLDRDTKGQPGTPDIVNTIFDKIANSHLFLCDISIVNNRDDTRKMPNPNVLVELGYAAAILGWENIICLFNAAYGTIEDLPFDLKFRRPVIYSSQSDASSEKKRLIKQIELAIKSSHPEEAQKKSIINHEFKDESTLARKIAIEKPNYWQLKLAEELFITKLKPFNHRYRNVEEKLLFQRKVELSPAEFFGKISTETEHLSNTTEGLTRVFNEHLHPAMQGDNPIEILDAINRYFDLLENLLAWELNIGSWLVNEKLNEAHQLLLGITKQPIEATNTMPDQLRKVYENPLSKKVHTIDILFEEPSKILKLGEIIEYYSNRPYLLLEE